MRGVSAAAVMCVVAMFASSPSGASPQRPGVTPIDRDLLAARESAWRAYFGGDVKTLGDLLPQEFIGIGMNGGPFADRATTLDGSRTFKEQGGRLVSLEFPQTESQRYGDTVVLYGRYQAIIESGGEKRTMRGRLTEVFVWREGKWVHPGWHLDLTTTP
jgi:hypothetical protein